MCDITSQQLAMRSTKLTSGLLYKPLILVGAIFMGITRVATAQVPVQDSLALVALYNALDGPHWTNHTNWLQPGKRVEEWYGINVDNGRVWGITLINNNAMGVLPDQVKDLTMLANFNLVGNTDSGPYLPTAIGTWSNQQLVLMNNNAYSGIIPSFLFQVSPAPSGGNRRQLSFGGNNFTGIDYSPAPGYSVSTLHINDNRLDFEDIEPLMDDPTIGFLNYAPQQPIHTTGVLWVHAGAHVVIKTHTGGSQNSYQWLSDATPIASATRDTLALDVSLADDDKMITARVTNPLVPLLTLERNPITLHVSNDVYTDCDAPTMTLQAGTLDPQAFFLWSTGEKTRSITVAASGKYGVHIETPNYIADDTLEVFLPATLSLGPDINSCKQNVKLISNVPNADRYVWQTPSGEVQAPSVDATINGAYTLTITSGACQKSDAVNVVVGSVTVGTFQVAAGTAWVDDGGMALVDVPLAFTNTTANVKNIKWSFGDLATAERENAVHTYAKAGTYSVAMTGTDGRDCPVTGEQTIVVQELLIASAITANGDGKNDKWNVMPFLFDAELRVVDRSGRTVFEAAPYQNDFTGQGLVEDVYYYDLYLRSIDKRYKGYVHILKH